jgi:uncharacterized repeat protein (TIGR03803 family)
MKWKDNWWPVQEDFVEHAPRSPSAFLHRPHSIEKNSNIPAGWVGARPLVRVQVMLAIMFAVVVAATQSAQAQTFTVLYTFKGSPDGANPYAGVILDEAGNLYGTTYWGGASYFGTAFKLDKSGKEKVLYSFVGGDGQNLQGRLVRDGKGNMYSTTSGGGAYGQGALFKLDKRGNETVLHSFSGPDGRRPQDGLVRDGAGNLYGTAFAGGNGGWGTVFRISNGGKITVLYSFSGSPDGAHPVGPLARDAAGNLYGTTQDGGSFNDYGTVFKIDKRGKETILHNFTGQDGFSPQAGLIRDAAGNLYGTTFWGSGTGCGGNGCGTVFKLDTAGKEKVLHSFTDSPDGAGPVGALVRDEAGNLYGTTAFGGATRYGLGTVFMLDPIGKETVLHSFSGADGAKPQAGLLLDHLGNLYGTTVGGYFVGGTVFKLTP